MMKTHIGRLLIGAMLLGTLTGCGVLTPDRIAGIHRTVATALEIAYESGGRDLLLTKIDEMVGEGRISPEQGEMLKSAAQKSYDAFLARLRELSEQAE